MKERESSERYYVLRLRDYALSDFCLDDKIYVGTEDEIRTTISEIETYDIKEGTADAVRRFLNGDKNVVRRIGCEDIPALEECEFIGSSEFGIGSKAWRYTSPSGILYNIKCDRASIKQILIRYKGMYYRCSRGWYDNLRYESSTGKKGNFRQLCAGPSYLYEVTQLDDGVIQINNRLYVVEVMTENAMIERTMQREDKLIYTAFCDDIVAMTMAD